MKAFLDELLNRYPVLNDCKEEIQIAGKMMLETYKAGGKILVCGNGGSCSDSDHIVGELMKGFLGKRKMSVDQQEIFRNVLGADAENLIEKLQCGIPAISLPAQSAILSAFANDVDAELVYAQMVFGYAKTEDLFIGLSTSGNSKNVVMAAKVAKATGMRTVALTGAKKVLCPRFVIVPLKFRRPKPSRFKSFICPYITIFAPRWSKCCLVLRIDNCIRLLSVANERISIPC